MRPGVQITQRSSPPLQSTPTDTGVWFVVGLSDSGPVAPTLIQSMADFTSKFGPRVSYSVLYDALDLYFREGGNKAYVSRVVGPAAVVASKTLLDAGAGVSLIVSALGPGASGNNWKVGVRAGGAGGTFVIFVQDTANANVEVEASPDLADQAAAINWGKQSSYISIALGATALPPAVVAAAALAGGNDDRASVTDAQWLAALNKFTPDLGIGQVSAPGRTTDIGHTQLLDHAAANNRVAILDAPDSGTQGTVTTSAVNARAGNQRYGGMFWPWVVIPGVITGVNRIAPPCGLVAGRLARNDGSGLGAAAPAAGNNGVSSYAVDLSQDPNLVDRAAMNIAGVNVIIKKFGTIRVYGWRSLVNPISDPGWVDLGNARLYMDIAGVGGSIAESYLFDKIDGQGKVISAFNGALAGMLANLYNNGDLYGGTATDAFFVDTGASVNTPTTLANNELHAVLNVRMAPFAELVAIEIFKRPINEGVTS